MCKHVFTNIYINRNPNTSFETDTAKQLILSTDEAGNNVATESTDILLNFPKFKTFVLIITSQVGTLPTRKVYNNIAFLDLAIISGNVLTYRS